MFRNCNHERSDRDERFFLHAMARGFGRHGGGPEGPGGGGRFGRRGGGGRVFASGDLRLVLLALVAERPRHGYELIKDIEELFGGAYAPSPGSVYPSLTFLEEIGQLSAEASEGSKKLYTITGEGTAYLAENKNLVDAVRMRMGMVARSMAGQRAPEAIMHAMDTLRTALKLHSHGWDDAEVERVGKILNQAALDIEAGKKD
ncbi:helix-turn-helix transcriptional regulator [Phyllobacterium sp. 628]|uniref:PadR family transcriptional regulator n=1 Tax=Phyllobacterium sp. 628 TaxID=2718938 RepID=UPI0016623A38|nr:PadR family transcriptional regulator [Phyllobacterium sp. 628]QND53277.1 helix-turn-helix transcriptional regulator [Phyllobacterium sp. 628]